MAAAIANGAPTPKSEGKRSWPSTTSCSTSSSHSVSWPWRPTRPAPAEPPRPSFRISPAVLDAPLPSLVSAARPSGDFPPHPTPRPPQRGGLHPPQAPRRLTGGAPPAPVGRGTRRHEGPATALAPSPEQRQPCRPSQRCDSGRVRFAHSIPGHGGCSDRCSAMRYCVVDDHCIGRTIEGRPSGDLMIADDGRSGLPEPARRRPGGAEPSQRRVRPDPRAVAHHRGRRHRRVGDARRAPAFPARQSGAATAGSRPGGRTLARLNAVAAGPPRTSGTARAASLPSPLELALDAAALARRWAADARAHLAPLLDAGTRCEPRRRGAWPR